MGDDGRSCTSSMLRLRFRNLADLAQPLAQEFGFTGSQIASLGVAAGIGSTLGAAFWGIAVDIIGKSTSSQHCGKRSVMRIVRLQQYTDLVPGRWWSFNVTVFITFVFGTAVGDVDRYSSYLVLSALGAFGIGGNIPIDTTIALE